MRGDVLATADKKHRSHHILTLGTMTGSTVTDLNNWATDREVFDALPRPPAGPRW